MWLGLLVFDLIFFHSWLSDQIHYISSMCQRSLILTSLVDCILLMNVFLLFSYMFVCVSMLYFLYSSALLYKRPSYFLNLCRLWSTNLKVSAKVLIVLHLLCIFMSHLWRVLLNRQIVTQLLMLAGSAPMAFSVKSIKVWIYSCKVSSGHCFLCKLLAACTSVVIGEYASSNLNLISCQLRSSPILFNILYGVLVAVVVTNSYSWLFIKAATFSICNSQSVNSMFFLSHMVMSLIRLSNSCHLVIFFIMTSCCSVHVVYFSVYMLF